MTNKLCDLNCFIIWGECISKKSHFPMGLASLSYSPWINFLSVEMLACFFFFVFFDWFSNTVLKFDPGAIILPVQLQSCWHNDSGILPVRCPACNIALQQRSGPCRSHAGPCAKVTEKVLNTAAGDIKPGFLTADRLGEAWDSQKCQDDSSPERRGGNLGPSILTDQFGIHQGPEIPLWHNTNSEGPTWQDISGGYCCVCVCVSCAVSLCPLLPSFSH